MLGTVDDMMDDSEKVVGPCEACSFASRFNLIWSLPLSIQDRRNVIESYMVCVFFRL